MPVEVTAEKPEAPVYFNLEDYVDDFINGIEVIDHEVVTAEKWKNRKR